ncbi:hypothetical protein [Paeniglutamicibacter gangotriensis]|uniref:Amino acid deaminase n=1 Tax=Paeniglutamicibacter gangotriensis Lz1y TaxID=1276920 RepID=M7NMW3_9MICC|nr:hypothetical protein [Paeniglutamicibacter gangotriensis]EMQ99848.1 hypothetical protein ADIAG_00951 [Paeniglutamicibacter gangotriensis Lz1y]
MMYKQIAGDAIAGRFERWGLSTVVDENVGVPVIGRKDFEQLHRHAGLSATWPVGNAGLIHVYGYLLSTVPTPYGLKRERWESGLLADALGLAGTAFLLADAHAGDQTVLQRVEAATAEILERPDESPGVLEWFDDGVESDGSRGDAGTFVRTVVVQREGTGSAALLYGVSTCSRMRILTAFPLHEPTAESVGALRAQPPRLRYNAVLPGLCPGAVLHRIRAQTSGSGWSGLAQ